MSFLELLRKWESLELDHIELVDHETRRRFKRVWRVAARRPV